MDLKTAIAEEKKRIRSELTSLNKEKAQLNKKIASLQKEMDAVLAYETAKKGKPSAKKSHKRGKPVNAQILDVLKGKSMKPKEIKEALSDVKPQTVSNTLATMKRKGVLNHKDGQYSVA